MEKIKKFRDLDNIKIISRDGKKEDIKDLFKDFQYLFMLMQVKLKDNKKWIYSEKDKVFYIFPQNKLVTTTIEVNPRNLDNIREEIEKISSKLEHKLYFSVPDYNQLKILQNFGFLENGTWYYKNDRGDYYYYSFEGDYCSTYSYSFEEDYTLGICDLDYFYDYLDKRNKNSEIESKELKDFETILEFNLLDTDVIEEKENIEKFKNLVKIYRIYKNYISCIYQENTMYKTEINIVFDIEKIISSIESKKEEFYGIEILYKDNEFGIEKEEIYDNKNIFYYKNGDIVEHGDGISGSFNISNEKVKKEDEEKIEKNSLLKYYLSIEKERINIDDYRENRLLDPNAGHWDLKDEDKEELQKIIGKKVYSRDPKSDVNQGGIVGIDFGTKSTIVVYQKDRNNILPMRIGGRLLNKEVEIEDYENPTAIEFRDIANFFKDYNEKIGRPYTKWQDITVSHTAFSHLFNGNSENFDSIITEIKQWTANKNNEIVIIDKKGKEILLPTYLELKENSEDYLDPIEIYAYYIGSYINTMRNGIYLEYYLSFPVTYEKIVREKILKSFEKGIKKSLPIQIQEDEKLMRKFKVRHGSSEPAAYATCVLKKLRIEPKDENDKVYYGVFDFGGGTTDFDFGIWKFADDEDMYDYELEHFGAGGDIYLGGENILKELAYYVFSVNKDELRKNEIQYTRPNWYPELSGEETLVENTREAKLNTRILSEKLREIWEENSVETKKILEPILYDSNGKTKKIELKITEDDLKNIIKNKIEKGIKSFFIKLEDAFKDENIKEVNIFLAGNSCKHPNVNEIFKKYQNDMKEKLILNIFDLETIEKIDENNDTKKITGKTGVAYGLIYSRKGGRIKVTNRDEKENIGNEVNFKYYVGKNKRDKFIPMITPSSKYEEYKFYGIVISDTFEIYYTTSSEAQTGEMEIGIDNPKIKRIFLNKEYDEDEKYRIYIKANSNQPTVLHYVIVKKEEDIEVKEFLEENDISLD